MANYCEYQIKAKGNKKDVILLYQTMPVYDGISLLKEKNKKDGYEMIFTGNCKWNLDAYCRPVPEDFSIDSSEYIDDKGNEIKDTFDFVYITLLEKSKLLNCDIEIFCEYEDGGGLVNHFHYVNGNIESEDDLDSETGIKMCEEILGMKDLIPPYCLGIYDDEDYEW